MLDPNLIATLETILRQTRDAQKRLMSRLREAETEVQLLREEIEAHENSADQTASAIDSLMMTMRSGSRNVKSGKSMTIEDDFPRRPEVRTAPPKSLNVQKGSTGNFRNTGSVAYLNQNRGLPARSNSIEPISHRFSDRTITQACTLLLRESAMPLHVNELYNLLVAGGMEFKGNNPTISVAVSLNRNRRFRKVGPGTFDLVMREAAQREAS
ncbi:hypothetical protein BH18ACI3_BH18ACI3_08660 [soil metagenome]